MGAEWKHQPSLHCVSSDVSPPSPNAPTSNHNPTQRQIVRKHAEQLLTSSIQHQNTTSFWKLVWQTVLTESCLGTKNGRCAEDHLGKQTVPCVPLSLQAAQCKATSVLLLRNDAVAAVQKWHCLLLTASSTVQNTKVGCQPEEWWPEHWYDFLNDPSHKSHFFTSRRKIVYVYKSWQLIWKCQRAVFVHLF